MVSFFLSKIIAGTNQNMSRNNFLPIVIIFQSRPQFKDYLIKYCDISPGNTKSAHPAGGALRPEQGFIFS